jgi:hypothetical protein
MVSRGNRWVLRILVVLVAGAAMLLYALHQRGESVVTIVNRSGRTIVEMKVTAGDQTVPYRNIADGESVTLPFVTSPSERLVIGAQLQDDTRPRYTGVAGEDGAFYRFNILPDGTIQPQSGSRR